MSYAVLQTEVVEPSLEQVHRAFVVVPGLTDHDDTLRARDATGLIARDLKHDEAWALFETLAAEGIVTSIVDDVDLPVLPTGFSLKQLDCGEEGLVVYDTMGRPRMLNWDQIQLVAAGWVRQTHIKGETRLPVSSGFEAESVTRQTAETRSMQWMVEVHVNVQPYRFRIDGSQLRCPYLVGASLHDAEQRIVQVINDLLRPAQSALVNRGVDALVRGTENRSYRSPQSFEREIVWLHWILAQTMDI
jgi:hypothetical protein